MIGTEPTIELNFHKQKKILLILNSSRPFA